MKPEDKWVLELLQKEEFTIAELFEMFEQKFGRSPIVGRDFNGKNNGGRTEIDKIMDNLVRKGFVSAEEAVDFKIENMDVKMNSRWLTDRGVKYGKTDWAKQAGWIIPALTLLVTVVIALFT